jgi:hypothetical protein
MYDRMLDAALTELVPAAGDDPQGLLASLLDLAERMLAELEADHPQADAGWTYQLVQVQIPAMREAAGITLDPPLRSELHPFAERELELRERYGIPTLT